MSILYYDKALHDKIKNWFPDNRMMILSPEETTRLFQNIADKVNDKPIKLPLIALSRDRNITVDVSTKRNLTYDGLKVARSGDDSKTMQLNAIPITANYQIDIYTAKYEEAYTYIREFIFNLVNHPRLVINIPYNGSNIEHVANLKFLGDIADNSDISERLFPGQFTRLTLQLELQDAYMFNTKVKDNWKIDTESTNHIEVIEPPIDMSEEDFNLYMDAHNGFIHIDEKETN